MMNKNPLTLPSGEDEIRKKEYMRKQSYVILMKVSSGPHLAASIETHGQICLLVAA